MGQRIAVLLAFGGPALALALAPARLSAQDGDPEAGAQAFRVCQACHTIEAGAPHRIGPNLHGVIGREAGTAEGFDLYSPAMKEADVVWTEETLDQFLADPRGFIPGNRMAFAGINDPGRRADIIAYIKQASE